LDFHLVPKALIMPTNISLFDYDLPESFIAQSSVEPRDHSKLMVIDRKTGAVEHKQFFNLIDELTAGDVLVFNTSKVLKARLLGRSPSFKEGAKGESVAELFVLRVRDGEIEALVKPGRKFPAGSIITVANHDFTVQEKRDDGVCILDTGMTAAEMLSFCDQHGDIPTPPYVEGSLKDESKYQTIYAKQVGSVAAPTAGFHFTPSLLEEIRMKGVQVEEVVLHVGIGTFRPVKTETLEEHEMHSEWVSLSSDTADRINAAKREGCRIIAVGTTTTRVLEGVAASEKAGLSTPHLRAYEGEINIFITPGFQFRVVDALITNFHLPKSTLLVLVSSFAGRERMLKAYEIAKVNGYRFFSFGDAMFIR
jgi:S-adenosylmethionine:tRNA ribosyltransferase-isomerase